MHVADIALELMRAESTSGAEGPAIDVAERLLSGIGWHTERIPIEAGRDAIFASSSGTSGEVVTLSTHLDTVPPYSPPRREGDVIYGRGACDAKGIAASMIVAAGKLRDAGFPIAMLFVVGEETAHDGAHAANEWITRSGWKSRAIVNGEPTENTLAIGTKGAMRFTLRTEGIPAHSAYPHLGRSATMGLVTLLSTIDNLELPTDEVLGDTTINVGHLAGGVADNVIAPWAEARCMARLGGEPEALEDILLKWIDGRASYERGVTIAAKRLGTLEGFDTSVAAYATDIPALSNWGTPYLYGPGSIHVAHTDHESVTVAELERAVKDYERIVRAILSSSGP